MMMLMLAIGAWAATFDLAYPGGNTTNMTGGNDAALFGLDATAWSVVGAKGASNNFPGLNQAGDIRLYGNAAGGNTLTVSSLNGSTINSITFEFTGDSYSNIYVEVDGETVTADEGVYVIGSSSFVVGNANASTTQVRIKKITIDYTGGVAPAVATPVIEGETPFDESTEVTISCATEGASIYYTLDGADPTSASTAYAGAFELTETTTVKAIAYDATGAASSVATKVFEKAQGPVSCSTVAEIKALADNTEFTFTGRLVVSGHAHASSGTNNWLFAQDETGGIQLFKATQDYEKNDVVPAGFTATKKTYNGAAQLQDIANMQAATETLELVAEELTPAQINLDKVFKYVVIKGATVVDNNITVGEESVVIYNNRFNTSIPSDGNTYDVYGITSYFNGTNQFMPLEFVPQAVEVATPVIEGETPFVGSTTVTITCATEGALIYYTTDGTEPTNQSTAYTAPFELSESATVKAIAYDVTGAASAIASKAFEKTLVITTVAEFNALPDNKTFVFNGNLVVSGQKNNYLYAQDATGGVLIYGNAGQTYTKGQVIPAGFTAKKTNYNGTIEMTNMTGMQAATETADLVAQELTISQFADNQNIYAVVKGATISGNTLTIGEETLAIYNRFGITFPTDDKTYDVYGVTTIYNNAPQLLPLEFVEAVEKTESPDIAYDEGDTEYVIFVNGVGELKLYADGMEVEIPYVVVRTNEDQTITFMATAQEEGKEISDPTVLTIIVPKLETSEIEQLFVVGTFNNWSQVEGMVELIENESNEFVGDVEFEAGAEFKLIAPYGNDWKWFGGEDANGVGYFLINNALLDVPILLIEGANFHVEEAGNYNITVSAAESKSVPEPLMMTIKKNAPEAIEAINMENVKTVRYYNMQGVESATPFKGVNIMVLEMKDGGKSVSKIVK